MSAATSVDWEVHRPLVRWIARGERGRSSEAIVLHLTGTRLGRYRQRLDTPSDPSDYRRCRLLLDQVPLLGLLFPGMKTASPQWAALVEHWDEIHETCEREVPGYMGDARGSAPEAYALIKRCLKTSPP